MGSNVLYQQICDRIAILRNLKEGFITNIFFDAVAVDLWGYDNKVVTFYAFDKSLFVVRENEGFHNLYFVSTTHAQLEENLNAFMLTNNIQPPLVVDIVGRDKDIAILKETLVGCGFSQYCSLVRMSRAVEKEEPQQGEITYASKEDSKQIDDLLLQYFDPLCEQLPTLRQIEQWIEQKRILLRKIDGEIDGFLIFEITGVTSYLRYWFTHPDYRNQKVGSSLLRQFFAESNSTKRQIFWVIESNENAIKRYEHYGFVTEKMYDKVMIKR